MNQKQVALTAVLRSADDLREWVKKRRETRQNVISLLKMYNRTYPGVFTQAERLALDSFPDDLDDSVLVRMVDNVETYRQALKNPPQ